MAQAVQNVLLVALTSRKPKRQTERDKMTEQIEGYDIHANAKLTLDVSDPDLETALKYRASKEGFSSVEAYCLEQIRSYLASEDNRFE